MNNKYKIKVGHPLIRPGLVIETEASERYVPEVIARVMEIVRNINRNGGSATKTFITTADGIVDIDIDRYKGDPK